MAAADYCEQWDLPRTMCAHCRGNPGDDIPRPNGTVDERLASARRAGPFPARYQGRCAEDCGEPIEVGDLIVGVEGTNYAHWACAT